jgi:protein disulfide-isomerase
MKKSLAFASLAVCLLLTVATLPAQQWGPQDDRPIQGEFTQPDNRAAKQQPGKQDQKPAMQPGKQDQKPAMQPGKPADQKRDDFKPGKSADQQKDDFKPGKPDQKPAMQPGKQDQKKDDFKPGKPADQKKDDFKSGKPDQKKDDFKHGKPDQKPAMQPGKPDQKRDDFKPGKSVEPPREDVKPDHHDHAPLGHELSAPAKVTKLRIPKAQGSTTPDGWFDDWNEARAEARRTDRSILVLFTGSDWCHWCKVLKKKVLNTKEFKRFAEQKLVLVYMDEPSKKTLPKRLRQTRTMLMQILQPGDGVPAIVLLTPDGKKIDTIQGYDEDLVDHLKQVIR